MTISIRVSVNGNYEVPVTVTDQDGNEVTETISGKGHEGPFVKDIPYYHGSNNKGVTVFVGEEKYVGD